MRLPRAVIPILLAVATFTLPISAVAKDTGGVAIKIQIGGHLLTQDTGLISPEVEGSMEDSGGVLASLIFLGKDRGRFPYGFGFQLDGNRVVAGPPLAGVGTQTFGIATVRIMGQMEFRLRSPRSGSQWPFQPYGVLGVGWNFHGIGEKITWPVEPPPPGTPLWLRMDDSPALRVGMGFHRKATEAGLSINLEGGWNWNAGDYRMGIQDMPVLHGSYDLSCAYFLFGITLRP